MNMDLATVSLAHHICYRTVDYATVAFEIVLAVGVYCDCDEAFHAVACSSALLFWGPNSPLLTCEPSRPFFPRSALSRILPMSCFSAASISLPSVPLP